MCRCEWEEKHACKVGSVVGMERQNVYPHCCSSVHTPLPRPATIHEKGVELGCVIGGHITVGQDIVRSMVNNATLDVQNLKQTQLKELFGWNTLLPDYGQYYITILYISKL